jgi:hypothetical protein
MITNKEILDSTPLKYNALHVREYSHIQKHDVKGYNAVIWTHPDIPMYGAELTVSEDGSFVVGKTLSEDEITGAVL